MHAAKVYTQPHTNIHAAIKLAWKPGEVTIRLQRGSALMSRVWPLSELSANTGLPWGSTPYSTTEPTGKPAVVAAVLTVASAPVLQLVKKAVF